jgi:hypothetical protein
MLLAILDPLDRAKLEGVADELIEDDIPDQKLST